jgi:hypothetical protein
MKQSVKKQAQGRCGGRVGDFGWRGECGGDPFGSAQGRLSHDGRRDAGATHDRWRG